MSRSAVNRSKSTSEKPRKVSTCAPREAAHVCSTYGQYAIRSGGGLGGWGWVTRSCMSISTLLALCLTTVQTLCKKKLRTPKHIPLNKHKEAITVYSETPNAAVPADSHDFAMAVLDGVMDPKMAQSTSSSAHPFGPIHVHRKSWTGHPSK